MDWGDVPPEVLEIAVNRRDALGALAEGPHHRRELQERLDVSKTTSHRIIRSFDDHGLVRRTEDGYRLTLLGQVVADQVGEFAVTVGTAARLRPLIEQLDRSAVSVDPTLFTDPEVAWSVDSDRSHIIDRGVERVRGTDVLRVLDWTTVPELYIEKIFDIMMEHGTRAESVYPRSEVANRLRSFPDLHDELLSRGGDHRYWVCDDVPAWGMTVYDDSLLELRAYDRESGAFVVGATTEHPRPVAWALEVFEDYRDRADPVTAVDDLPDWGDYSW